MKEIEDEWNSMEKVKAGVDFAAESFRHRIDPAIQGQKPKFYATIDHWKVGRISVCIDSLPKDVKYFSICVSENGDVWLSTDQGAFDYDQATEKLTKRE